MANFCFINVTYFDFVYILPRTKLGTKWKANFGPPMLHTGSRQNKTSLGPIDWIINEYLLTLFFISISVWWCYWHPVLSTSLMTAVIISCVVFRHFSVSLFLAARKNKENDSIEQIMGEGMSYQSHSYASLKVE